MLLTLAGCTLYGAALVSMPAIIASTALSSQQRQHMQQIHITLLHFTSAVLLSCKPALSRVSNAKQSCTPAAVSTGCQTCCGRGAPQPLAPPPPAGCNSRRGTSVALVVRQPSSNSSSREQ
jgi:hypothetical protein